MDNKQIPINTADTFAQTLKDKGYRILSVDGDTYTVAIIIDGVEYKARITKVTSKPKI